MAALVVDCPLVVTPHYHGASADSFRDHLLNLYQPLLGSAVRRADAVIAVSEWERRQLAADFGVDASVIPNGVDVERFSSATPDTRDTPYLLCVGRVEEYKGIQHVIRSLPKHDYDLVVAGSGPYLAELRSLAADLGVVDRVSFEGYVDDERLPRLYAGAAAYVTMSEFEAYGMTVAEALAAGTPCVVREAGALVDWADRTDCVGVGTDALVEGISTAVNLEAPTDPLPTWDRVYDRIEAIYGSVK